MVKNILLIILFHQGVSFAQDPEFSQFYANPVYLNPAMVGTQGCGRLNLNSRNQWANLSGAYVTNSVSYDRYVNRLHGGIGVMVTNDMAGHNTLNWSTVNLIYAYHLQLSKRFTLIFGGQAAWNQKFLDWSKLTFGDQIDPYRGFSYQTNDLPSGLINDNSSWSTAGFFDVSAGLVGFSENFYFGFAARHLNTPNQSVKLGDSRLPMRFTAHAGAKIPLVGNSVYENKAAVYPNIIYTQQLHFRQLNLGTYINYGVLTTGIWWRSEDAFIVSIGLDYSAFRFGYSYDTTISPLTNASGGAHEISLGFNFGCKELPDKFRTVICPSF